MSYHAKIKVFYRLPTRGRVSSFVLGIHLTERVGKQAACGIASSFLGLQNPWLRLPVFQGDSLSTFFHMYFHITRIVLFACT